MAPTAALHFKVGTNVFKGAHNEIDRITLFEFLADLLKGGVDDALRKGALAAFHDHVDQCGHKGAVVAGIRNDGTFNGLATA